MSGPLLPRHPSLPKPPPVPVRVRGEAIILSAACAAWPDVDPGIIYLALRAGEIDPWAIPLPARQRIPQGVLDNCERFCAVCCQNVRWFSDAVDKPVVMIDEPRGFTHDFGDLKRVTTVAELAQQLAEQIGEDIAKDCGYGPGFRACRDALHVYGPSNPASAEAATTGGESQ